MDSLAHIKEAMDADFRHLVWSGDSIWFARKNAAFLNKGPNVAPVSSIDLVEVLRAFRHFAGNKDEFTMPEVARYAGLPYHTVDHMVRDNVLHASIRKSSGSGKGKRTRLFSASDTFAAFLLGVLIRHGVRSRAVLGKLLLFICGFDGPIRDNTEEAQAKRTAKIDSAKAPAV